MDIAFWYFIAIVHIVLQAMIHATLERWYLCYVKEARNRQASEKQVISKDSTQGTTSSFSSRSNPMTDAKFTPEQMEKIRDAGPELYEALQHCLEHLQYIRDHGPGLIAEGNDAVNEGLAAIAKADGR